MTCLGLKPSAAVADRGLDEDEEPVERGEEEKVKERERERLDVAHRKMKTITANATRAFTTSLMVRQKRAWENSCSMALRLALLICDEVIPSVKAVHGDYSQIFTRLLSLSLARITSGAYCRRHRCGRSSLCRHHVHTR